MDDITTRAEGRDRFQDWADLMGRMLPAVIAQEVIRSGKRYDYSREEDFEEEDLPRCF